MDTSNAQQIIELNAQGTQYHLNGRLSKAADCYRQALLIDPDNATSHNNLGFLLAQQHQWKEGLTHLRRAVALAPNNSDFLSNLGQVLAETGLWQDGLKLLLRAADLEPDNVRVWQNLGRLHSNMDDAAGAEKALRQAWKRSRHDVCIITELASAIAMQNRNQEAVILYRRALEIHPGYADAWVQLGVSLFLEQDYTEARDALQQALSLDASNYSTLRHLAYVYSCLNDRDKALESFRNLLRYFPDADSVRLDLAVLLLADKQNQAACEQLAFLYRNNNHNDRIIFYYGLSLYQSGEQAEASDIWKALESSDSPYRLKIGEFVKG